MSTQVNDQADGRLGRVGGEWQLRFVRRLAHPREKAWRAIAEAEHRDMLGYALDGTAPPWTGEQRWRQLHPAYVSQFGPEAATIGPPAGHPVLDESAAAVAGLSVDMPRDDG